jgi:multidrug efflux system membrane fusion protein
LEIKVVGTVEASATVQVKSQVAGQLLKVHFTEGQNVQDGALLFEIDSRPYREALRQAEAAVAKDQAQLRQAEATLARDQAQSKNADADAKRYAELAKSGIISGAQYDQVRTSADVYRESVRAAQAAIESARANLQADLAAVERAKLDIGYCEIRSPISGRTGNLLVDPGNLVRANADDPLVVIHKVAPIFVNFSVPEQHLGEIRRASTSRKLPVRVSVQDQPDRSALGQVIVIDNAVDSTTGTIKLKASLPNTDAFLWPGQFVNVALALDTISNATVVPSEAVQAGQQGQFIYVVKGDDTVEARPVQAGQLLGRRIVINEGVKPGDRVVTDGHLRLYPGARIKAVDPAAIEGQKL